MNTTFGEALLVAALVLATLATPAMAGGWGGYGGGWGGYSGEGWGYRHRGLGGYDRDC